MAAPATNGVLHTKLSDMKIGDYIRAEVSAYTSPAFCGDISIGGGAKFRFSNRDNSF